MLGSGSLAGLLLGWTGAGPLLAQPAFPNGSPPAAVQGAPVQRNFLNKRDVQLPIQITEAGQTSLQEVRLYSKNHPASPWVLKETVSPAQKAFTFRAPADGEYYFTMVTVDKKGRCYPADLRNEPPGLAIVIDTQAPTVELTNLGAGPEGQMIQVDVADANLDIAKVRFSYQAGDKGFRLLEPMPGRGNVFCIPAQAVCTGLVQVIAEDMALNQTTRQEFLARMKSQTAQASNTQPAGGNVPPATQPEPKSPGSTSVTPNTLPKGMDTVPPIDPRDAHQVQKVAPPTPERQSLPRPNGSEGPHWSDDKSTEPVKTGARGPAPDGGVIQTTNNTPQIGTGPSLQPITTKNAAPKRQIVNSGKVYLDYQIENAAQASVSKVEVWLTRDQGQSWQKHSEVSGAKSPIEVQLPGDGIYGMMLVASNGTSAVAPPAAGDQPDGLIEVDTTKPTLQINDIQASHDKGQTVVQIRWTAQDKNLADAPVDLFYAATPQGPWLLIAKGLPAKGEHRWTPPAGLGAQTHLQLIARDAAGNTAVCGTLEPVSIAEPPRPRAVIRTISTGLGGPQLTQP